MASAWNQNHMGTKGNPNRVPVTEMQIHFAPSREQISFGSTSRGQRPFQHTTEGSPVMPTWEQNPLPYAREENPVPATWEHGPGEDTREQRPSTATRKPSPFGFTDDQRPFPIAVNQDSLGIANEQSSFKQTTRDQSPFQQTTRDQDPTENAVRQGTVEPIGEQRRLPMTAELQFGFGTQGMQSPQTGVGVRRLQKEYAAIKQQNLPFFTNMDCVGGNIFVWQGLLRPRKSPFCEGAFQIQLTFPARYPFQPPNITFFTPIYHPNVHASGGVCFRMLYPELWKPCNTVQMVLQALVDVINDPDPDCFLRSDVAQEFVYQRKEFEKKVRKQMQASNQRLNP